jgi:hypothetical protein
MEGLHADSRYTGRCRQQADGIVVIGTWKEEPLPPTIASLIEADDWNGAFKKTLLVYVTFREAARSPKPGEIHFCSVRKRRVLLVGLGERDQWSAERSRQLGAVIGQKVRELKQTSFPCPCSGG